MMKPGLVTITGIGKRYCFVAIAITVLSFAFDMAFNNPSFTVQYPFLSFVLFMFFGLSFPFLLVQGKKVQTRQKAFIARSCCLASLLNEERKQAVQNQEFPATVLCPVCNVQLIVDKRYQLCATCKQRYAAEIKRIRVQKYRARQANEPDTLTVVEWIHTLQAFHFLCAYCQKARFTVMEHYQPIGTGVGTIQENCVPACRKCNAQKSNKRPE